MAVTFTAKDDSGRALYPLRYISQLFLSQTLDDIQLNLETQHVWPVEIYPNFHSINEIRRQQALRAAERGKKGPWYSTGQGVKSFEGNIIRVDEEAGVVELAVRYSDYMQYVDIGVGAGRKADDVERSRKVRYQNRYTTWNPSGGKSHRPAILPTLRHLATRLSDYTSDYLGTKAEYNIYETFEGLTIYI